MRQPPRFAASITRSPRRSSPRGQGRPGARAIVAFACFLAFGPLLLAVSEPTPWTRGAAAAECVDATVAANAGTNWGGALPAICPPGQTAAGVVNWGGASSAAVAVNPGQGTGGPVRSLDEAVGQATGEVGIPPQLLSVCSKPPCAESGAAAAQSMTDPGVCSKPPCNTQTLALPAICSSPPCENAAATTIPWVCSRPPCETGGSPIPVICSRPPCPTATGTIVPPDPRQVQRPNLGPEWAKITQWIPDILAAQTQVNNELGVLVPTNVVMAIMRIETGGEMPDGPNEAGARGLMQITPMTFGAAHYDFERLNTDAAYSIYCGVYELASRYKDTKNYNDEAPGQPLPWANVIVGFFSGHYFPTGAADGYNSDFEYQQAFIRYFSELEAAGGTWSGGDWTRNTIIPGNWLAGVGQPIAGLVYLWGGDTSVILTQEFGPTDFSVTVNWYDYSLQYGFTQPGHTGLDIGTIAGTPLFAPADATIYCAGTNNPGFPNEEACVAFESSYGGWTSGRLQMELPNGEMLIYGHVNQTVVKPGAKVKQGDLVGYSGGMNGDHVHIEYRTLDSTTMIGWRLIDPRLTQLNGNKIQVAPVTKTPSGSPTPTPTVTTQPEVTVAVTETATEALTVAPTEIPTLAPTQAATEAPPTVPPTTPPDTQGDPAPTVPSG